MKENILEKKRPLVVVVGGGFGGLKLAQKMPTNVDVLLIDRTNHHLFQPLLYQVAMAGLAPSDIASPLRAVLRHKPRLKVLMEEVIGLDLIDNKILTASNTINFDYLVLAPGMTNNYYNHPEWEGHTFSLKTLPDAVKLRNHLLACFEQAEKEKDAAERSKYLRFVICGAGPTGVEVCGSLLELCKYVLAKDFRNIDLKSAQVILIERGPKVLGAFKPTLSASALAQLQSLGVQVILNQQILDINHDGVKLDDNTFLSSYTKIWTAGVKPVPLIEQMMVKKEGGRVVVQEDCSVPGHPNVFVIGDAAWFKTAEGKVLPGVSPVAMQQGAFVAKKLCRRLEQKEEEKTFKYFDKGSMATIGRGKAVADLNFIKLSGPLAWLAWLFVHLLFLIGFRNKIVVLINWLFSYFTYQRGSRLITDTTQSLKHLDKEGG